MPRNTFRALEITFPQLMRQLERPSKQPLVLSVSLFADEAELLLAFLILAAEAGLEVRFRPLE